jgi:[DsrC]-trisulfide reductase subunit P
MIFLACWIDKGLGLVIGGLAITPLERVASYTPTVVELLITAGVYAIGALVLTVLYKIAITVKESETVQKPASCGCADGACSTVE